MHLAYFTLKKTQDSSLKIHASHIFTLFPGRYIVVCQVYHMRIYLILT